MYQQRLSEPARLQYAVEKWKRKSKTAIPAPDHWREWLYTLMPDSFTAEFAPKHIEFWEWVVSIEAGEAARPFVWIVGRGGGKSTNLEAATIYLAAKGVRQYFWYVSETQAQADEHVQAIATKLVDSNVDQYYPDLAARSISKYGHSQGWRRNRLITKAGAVWDALGLDTLRRGVKIGDLRFDFCAPDDIDNETDTPEKTAKKEVALTKRIFPAGSPHAVIAVTQNLVIPNGVVARLADGRAKYLAGRIVSGPHEAVEDLQTENANGRDMIIGGVATWEGQNLETCQKQIDEWGLIAFKQEAQHEVHTTQAGVFNPATWEPNKETGEAFRFHIKDTAFKNEVIARWQFWDTALKDKATNDPSGCLTVDVTPGYQLAIRDYWTDRIESTFLPDRMVDLAQRWNGDGKLKGIVPEDKGSGTTSIQTLRKSAPAWLADMVYEFMPHGSKVYRAKLANVWCGRGCVLLPYPDDTLDWYAPNLDPLTGQLFRFPNVPHDEFVDCLSMAILYLENFITLGWQARMAGVELKHGKRVKGKDSRVARAKRNERKR